MHYKNGRPAKIGDVIAYTDYSGLTKTGIVVDAQGSSETCNLKVAPIPDILPYVTAKDASLASDLVPAPYAPPAVPAEPDGSAAVPASDPATPPAPAAVPASDDI